MRRSRFLSYASNVNGHNSHGSHNNEDDSNANVRPTDTMNHTNTMTLPMLSKPASTRNNITAFLGEFVGTFLFLFFSFAGTQIAVNSGPATLEPGTDIAVPNTQNLMFIALVFGLSLMANVWAFYRVTGGLFNPSVTLALFLVGGLSAVRSVIVVVAQLLAGMAAAGVVSALFPGPMDVDTTLGGGANVAQGLFIEMFLTAELVFVVIMVAAEKHKSTYLAPVAIGMAFFLAELVVGVYFTGGSLNFARSLGPAVVNRSFPSYFWIYFLGPIMGSLLASGFYALLKYLRWKECNPGQDVDDEEKLKFDTARVQEKERYGSVADGHVTPRETVTPPNGAVSPGGTTVADSPTAARP
ncbi:putative aquaporin [Cercophora samala]|uniref:Aquaporin n=1 Tax=Cercophora samala TaxID=330535 RepID=A0AA39ZIK5_9PEZI|nr:putative aquaporin [Cercophora samala]